MSAPSSRFSHIPVHVDRDRRYIERTAYHEAGHAVMAFAAGRRFVDVTVSSTERLLGNVRGIEAGWDVALLRHHPDMQHDLICQEWVNALIRLAGPMAEWMGVGSVLETSGDLHQAAVHLQAIRPTLELHSAVGMAMRRRPHVRAVLEHAWPAVEALVVELSERGTVEYARAEVIYWHALPDGVPSELLRCPLPEGRKAEAAFLQTHVEDEAS